MVEAASPRRGARTGWWLSAFLLATVHVALVNYYLPIHKVFGERPITGADYDLHIGQVSRVVEGLTLWGKSWVYDVRLVAGQPEGTITDAGSKGWELWTYALFRLGVPLPIAFNTFVLLIMLIGPLIVYLAARNFDFDPGESLLAAAFVSATWFFDSTLHWIWWVGMISWACASGLSVLTIALFYRMLRSEDWRWSFPCGLSLALGHLIHPYSFFVLTPALIALYVRGFRRRVHTIHFATAGIVAFTLAINAFWLNVARQHWHYILDSGFYARGGIVYLFSDFFELLLGADTGVIGVRSGFRILFLALAIAWLFLASRRSDPRVLPLAIALGTSLFLAYVLGDLPGGRQVQPYRNLTVAILLTTIPAAAFVDELISTHRWGDLTLTTRALAVALGVSLLQLLSGEVLYFIPRLLPVPDNFPDGAPFPVSVHGFASPGGTDTVHYGLPHDPEVEIGLKDTIHWLETHVPKGSRLLVEGAALGERIAWSTTFEVMGGFKERNVAHAYANYFRSFEHHPANAEQLVRYLETFGIDWVVLMLDHPEFDDDNVTTKVVTKGLYRIYRNVAHVSTVRSGRAQVVASTNLIEVSDSETTEPLVLAYHFHEALRCEPSCKVERQPEALDRVGFIRVPAPHPQKFRIFNSYEMR